MSFLKIEVKNQPCVFFDLCIVYKSSSQLALRALGWLGAPDRWWHSAWCTRQAQEVWAASATSGFSAKRCDLMPQENEGYLGGWHFWI